MQGVQLKYEMSRRSHSIFHPRNVDANIIIFLFIHQIKSSNINLQDQLRSLKEQAYQKTNLMVLLDKFKGSILSQQF